MGEKATRIFKRGLSKSNVIEKTRDLFSGPLGKNILKGSPKQPSPFQVCIRDNYLNVYWNGCSVLKFSPNATKNVYMIHDKYVREKRGKSKYLSLEDSGGSPLEDLTAREHKDWSFLKEIVEPALNGKIPPSLEEYATKKTNGGLTEKGLLKVYLETKRPFLLDLEVAFTRIGRAEDGEPRPVADRIDVAEIVYDEKDNPILRLVEVKTSDDSRLRAQELENLRNDSKKIMHQMGLYQDFLNNEEGAIRDSYRTVASNMHDLGFGDYMNGLGERTATEVLRDFSKRGEVDPRPHLLVLYAQKDKCFENKHLERVQQLIMEKYPPLRYICVGNE